jgi:hypothetical protein
LAGRRRRYIRPARLYLFATLIFFAASRFFVEPAEVLAGLDASSRDSARNALVKPPGNRKPEDIVVFKDGAGQGLYLDNELALHVPPALAGMVTPLQQHWERFNAMPQHKKEDHMVAGILRFGPYAMFALLPAFGLMLKLLYTGRRRRYPLRPRLYGEHMVFAAHNHAFVFVMATADTASPGRRGHGSDRSLDLHVSAVGDAPRLRGIEGRNGGTGIDLDSDLHNHGLARHGRARGRRRRPARVTHMAARETLGRVAEYLSVSVGYVKIRSC